MVQTLLFSTTGSARNLRQMLALAVASGGAERRRRTTAQRSERRILEYFYGKLEELHFEKICKSSKYKCCVEFTSDIGEGSREWLGGSDADDRLQRAPNDGLQVIFIGGMKNIGINQFIMILDI